MSPELLGVLIGGAIGVLGSVVGGLLNHYLEISREKRREKIGKSIAIQNDIMKGVEIFRQENKQFQSLMIAFDTSVEKFGLGINDFQKTVNELQVVSERITKTEVQDSRIKPMDNEPSDYPEGEPIDYPGLVVFRDKSETEPGKRE